MQRTSPRAGVGTEGGPPVFAPEFLAFQQLEIREKTVEFTPDFVFRLNRQGLWETQGQYRIHDFKTSDGYEYFLQVGALRNLAAVLRIAI